MCLLGKKYPEDVEAFRRSRLPGTWDESRAGKRMKLATPETWETTVSMHGNKAHTWEQLIDNNYKVCHNQTQYHHLVSLVQYRLHL